MKGKGSFLVNSASGIVLYEPLQPRDSKVIVASSSADTRGPDLIRRSRLGRQLSENRNGSRKALKKHFYNVRNEENAYEEAISKSLRENDRDKAEAKKDMELFEKAVSLSLLEKEKESDEEKDLAEVIEISKRESIVNAMDEDERIQKSLALSQAEYDQRNDPDAYLQQVLELSRNERSGTFVRSHGEDEEDEGLLKALELSVLDF